MLDKTMTFSLERDREGDIRRILTTVYDALKEKGYQFFIDSPTNQIFIVLEDCQMEELGKKVEFGFWEKYDENHTVVRFATSWGTKMEDIEELIRLL